MMPKVSIFVGIYKGGRFLQELLDSVRAQTFSDWTRLAAGEKGFGPDRFVRECGIICAV